MNGEIAIFFTGGTITMQPRADDRGVAPGAGFDQLMAEIGRQVQGVGLRPISWGDRPSPHMTPPLMFALARDIAKALSEPEVLGAVVLHGTDVLVESTYMADLVVSSTKPVVFTGSMRYVSELGYDGIRNLVGGLLACQLPLPPEMGVVLLMTDRFFAAREVEKVNSIKLDAFEAPEAGPVGYVVGDRVVLTRRPAVRKQSLTARAIEPDVPLVTSYTGMDGAVIRHLADAGAAGLVVEGFGAGNVPPDAADAMADMAETGRPVVLTTRCLEGGVWPIYAYPGGAADLAARGVILGGRLSGPKARILLMAALGATRDPESVRRVFQEP